MFQSSGPGSRGDVTGAEAERSSGHCMVKLTFPISEAPKRYKRMNRNAEFEGEMENNRHS